MGRSEKLGRWVKLEQSEKLDCEVKVDREAKVEVWRFREAARRGDSEDRWEAGWEEMVDW